MVGRLLSRWDGIFSGAMLNFQEVLYRCKCWYVLVTDSSPMKDLA